MSGQTGLKNKHFKNWRNFAEELQYKRPTISHQGSQDRIDPNEQMYNDDGQGINLKTSYTSVLDNSFKHTRSNQAEILKQLRKEYERLHESAIEPIKFRVDLPPESDSNAQSYSQFQSEQQERPNIAVSQRNNKSKLQIALNNSMIKIEKLLQEEISLKRTIHQLQKKLSSEGNSTTNYQTTISQMHRTERDLNETVTYLRRDQERNKAKIGSLIQDISILEGKLLMKEIQQGNQYEKIGEATAVKEDLQYWVKKCSEKQAQLQRVKQESQFKTGLLKMEFEHRLKQANEDWERICKTHTQKVSELECSKAKLESQIEQNQRELQQYKRRELDLQRDKHLCLQNIKSDYEDRLKKEREVTGIQMKNLLERVESLTQLNERYMNQSEKYARIEGESLELRRVARTVIRSNEGIKHMWEVKNVQFGVVMDILGDIK